MQFTAEKKGLLRVIEQAATVASKELANVMSQTMLSVDGSTLSVTAMDITLQYVGRLPILDAQTGAILAPCRGLLDRIKALPDGDILVRETDSGVELKTLGQRRVFRLSTAQVDSFPKTVVSATGQSLSVSTKALSDAIGRVIHAVSTDINRIALNSMHVKRDGESLTFTATDGYRLARTSITLSTLSTEGLECLIPLRGVVCLKRFIESAGDEFVGLSSDGAALCVVAQDETLSVKLANADAPPYDMVIPSSKPTCTATIKSKSRLISALKASQLAAGDSVGVNMVAADGELWLTSKSAENGEMSDSIECEVAGKSSSACCTKYLIDALSGIDGDSARIEWGDLLDPIVVRDGATSDTQLVMPVRT